MDCNELNSSTAPAATDDALELAIANVAAAASTKINVSMAQAYLQLLSSPDAREGYQFAPLMDWGIRVVNEDNALIDAFSISRATLKRWASGETTPGPLARDSAIGRMQKIVRERAGLPDA